MSEPATISAAIIALDEASNLAELLPILHWADEVVVVDGGSRDATVRVARSHGCRVASRRFDTFAGQRNYALRLARGDWVFSIDADERPTPPLAAEIRRRTEQGRADAFRVPIRSWVFGGRLRCSGTQDDRPVRLFRRRAARWAGSVHEVLRVRGRVAALNGWLEHRPAADLEAFLAKMHRYTLLEAGWRASAGRPPRRRDPWIAPPREVFRRLIWKLGLLDGPAGWAFCLLSGLSEWTLARRHRQLWNGAGAGWDARLRVAGPGGHAAVPPGRPADDPVPAGHEEGPIPC